MAKKGRNGKPRRASWRRRLGPLAIWAVIAAAVGATAFVFVYAVTGAGGGSDNDSANHSSHESSAQVGETPSDPSKGQPFQGGPRLYFPTASMDLGQVPFMTTVSKSFDLKNVGDAPLKIEDVQVKMLEGC